MNPKCVRLVVGTDVIPGGVHPNFCFCHVNNISPKTLVSFLISRKSVGSYSHESLVSLNACFKMYRRSEDKIESVFMNDFSVHVRKNHYEMAVTSKFKIFGPFYDGKGYDDNYTTDMQLELIGNSKLRARKAYCMGDLVNLDSSSFSRND